MHWQVPQCQMKSSGESTDRVENEIISGKSRGVSLFAYDTAYPAAKLSLLLLCSSLRHGAPHGLQQGLSSTVQSAMAMLEHPCMKGSVGTWTP